MDWARIMAPRSGGEGGRRAQGPRLALVAPDGLTVGGAVAVAWDGGKGASRAVRTATPLLRKASRVVILSPTKASPRRFAPELLKGFLDARGVKSDVEALTD